MLASLAFWFTRKPSKFDYEFTEKVVLKNSHLSNVNDYFNTTFRSEVQSNGESFQATFVKNTEIEKQKKSKSILSQKKTETLELDRSGKSLDEKLFPIKEDQLEASTSRHNSHNRMGTEKGTTSRSSMTKNDEDKELLKRAETERSSVINGCEEE